MHRAFTPSNTALISPRPAVGGAQKRFCRVQPVGLYNCVKVATKAFL